MIKVGIWCIHKQVDTKKLKINYKILIKDFPIVPECRYQALLIRHVHPYARLD